MSGMPKSRGKGRISNKLVAASCAAVLAVYAAGYWRTREAARQFEMQAKARRPAARAQRTVSSRPTPTLIQASSPAPRRPRETPATIAPTVASAQGSSSPMKARRVRHTPASTATASAMAGAAVPSSPVAASDTLPVPASTDTGMVVHPVPMPSELAPAPRPVSGPPATPAAKWRDGIYSGHGDSPHGDIEVRVVIKDGRIVEAVVDVCNTRYRCELLDPMVQQVVVLQSSDVDYISRATESSEAYSDGLVEALGKALDQPPGKEAASQ
jgi:uncharacterized protein with FMN-binding domain